MNDFASLIVRKPHQLHKAKNESRKKLQPIEYLLGTPINLITLSTAKKTSIIKLVLDVLKGQCQALFIFAQNKQASTIFKTFSP